MKNTTLAIAFALLFSACSGEDDPPPTEDENGEPVQVDYTGDELPRGIVDDGVPYDEAELPIPQEGTDSGEPGITYAAVLGGYYLLRVQKPEGDFNYQYNATLGEFETDEDSIHRQAGSTITQGWMWRVTGRPEFRVSARRAIDNLVSRADEQEDGSLKVSNMGGSALLAIATSVFVLEAETDDYDEELEALGQFILNKISEDGEFEAGDRINLAQGQAMMALEHLHAATGDDKWLDALEKVADWYVANPDAHGYGRFFGLWANEPLTYLDHRRPDDGYADIAYGIADKILAEQHIPGESEKKSWEGGYFSSNDSERPLWNTCLRLEAVIDAYRMAKLRGDEERAKDYAQSAEWAAAFLMRLQIRAGDMPESPDPDFIVGAVPFSSSSNKLRIDVTHHVAQSLLKTVEYLQLEEFPGRRAPDEVSP